MKGPVTSAQKKVLEFIEREIHRSGIPPTFRAIQTALGYASVFAAQRHVKALIQKGLLSKEAGISRGITLPSRVSAVGIPILGSVPAGVPLEEIENRDGTLPVPESLARKSSLYALRVRGDSMIGAGIIEGDLVIVRQQSDANSGDIVVALLDGESTVKRLEIRKGTRLLKAENPKYAPIPIVNEKDQIQGKVLAVWRTIN